MARDIEIILTKDTKNVGKFGQKKRVKRGFAKNFLLPQGLAMVVTDSSVAQFAQLEKIEAKRMAKVRAAAEEVKKSLDGKKIVLTSKAHQGGKLYGSITPTKVADALKKEYSVQVAKEAIAMPDHYKEVGQHEIEIDLGADVKCKIKLEIKASPESDEKPKKSAS